RTALRLRRVAHLRALRLHGTRRGRRAGLARRPTDATGVGASPRPGGRGSSGARPRLASVHAWPGRVARRARSRRDGTGARRPAALEPHIEDRSGPDAWRGARRLPVAVGGCPCAGAARGWARARPARCAGGLRGGGTLRNGRGRPRTSARPPGRAGEPLGPPAATFRLTGGCFFSCFPARVRLGTTKLRGKRFSSLDRSFATAWRATPWRGGETELVAKGKRGFS